ncbi:BatA domain-containing protein [Spongiivirga citrea]|uniref:Aerotolerance regulator N-terminal domain-containing protein n=1 Tax=Spongiivirga citrea TaxID=1481457 RepID=A0A6M0CKX3_9FLAO|nr:BatA domain-containing protein [Spongiivirga citrea]NER16499.1 hypothetical protein [Spongiivirga citrea]
MQFKNPELLYAFFLLIIPIIVHLFQLRKFRKVAFTNVQFLKEVTAQTRKSSQLKKWLVLLTRLLALAFLIIAFAQPFIANKAALNNKKNQIIYLDNSFSMQAKGANGPLYDQAVQQLLQTIPEEEIITLFTNTTTFKDVTTKDIRDQLLKRDFSNGQLNFNQVVSKGQALFNNANVGANNIVVISDFQQDDIGIQQQKDSTFQLDLVQLKAVNNNNIALDTVYISESNANDFRISVGISNQGDAIADIPISLYDGDDLLAKTAVSISSDGQETAEFVIPINKKIQGKISIEDANIPFDNELFFSINEPQKIKVLAINEADDSFLKRIYTEDEFVLQSTAFEQLNYNVITDQNLIVLNELTQIPLSLNTALKQFTDEGGTLIVIPSQDINLNSYNTFLQELASGPLLNLKQQSRKITEIVFDHPFMQGIFDKRVSNFQYPTVNTHYGFSSTNGLLQYDNKTAFLAELGTSGFLFTASLSVENGNFKNAPLIAPIFYKMGKQSLQLPSLYYTVGADNSYDVQAAIAQDQIIALSNENINLIPLQRVYTNRVEINTTDKPDLSGRYQLTNNNITLQEVSYNYDRKESKLQYHVLDKNAFSISNSVSETLQEIQNKYEVNALWKWFAIFAALCLLLEMIILKYYK